MKRINIKINNYSNIIYLQYVWCTPYTQTKPIPMPMPIPILPPIPIYKTYTITIYEVHILRIN